MPDDSVFTQRNDFEYIKCKFSEVSELLNSQPKNAQTPKKGLFLNLTLNESEITTNFSTEQLPSLVDFLNFVYKKIGLIYSKNNITFEIFIFFSFEELAEKSQMVDISGRILSLKKSHPFRKYFNFDLKESTKIAPIEVNYNPFKTEWSNLRQFDNVVIGGTFDYLHQGHKILLTIACLICKNVLAIGVTTEEMLNKKDFKGIIIPFEARWKKVKDFVTLINPLIEFRIMALSNSIGNTLDEGIDALVVSKETESVAIKINEMREGISLPKLEIVSIDLSFVPPAYYSSSICHPLGSTPANYQKHLKNTKISSSIIRNYCNKVDFLYENFLKSVNYFGMSLESFRSFFEIFVESSFFRNDNSHSIELYFDCANIIKELNCNEEKTKIVLFVLFTHRKELNEDFVKFEDFWVKKDFIHNKKHIENVLKNVFAILRKVKELDKTFLELLAFGDFNRILEFKKGFEEKNCIEINELISLFFEVKLASFVSGNFESFKKRLKKLNKELLSDNLCFRLVFDSDENIFRFGTLKKYNQKVRDFVKEFDMK